jgi:hypothetical protein
LTCEGCGRRTLPQINNRIQMTLVHPAATVMRTNTELVAPSNVLKLESRSAL